MGRRPQRILTSQDNHDLTSDTIWLTTAQDGSKWDSMECDFISSRLKKPTRLTTPHHHDYDNPTNNTRTHNVHGSSPRPRRRRQQRRRKRRRRYATHFLPNRQLNLRNTKATTAKETRVNHISSFWDRCRPTLF